MRILHIGDFHFRKQGSTFEQNTIVSKLTENLKNRAKIDIVLFSGDLVFSGKSKEDFEAANDLLLSKLKLDLNIDHSNIIICAGNHDINRANISESIIRQFHEKANDVNYVEDFYKKGSVDLRNSLLPSKEFHEFIKANYASNYDTISELLNVATKQIDGKLVGFVTINSAWLSSGIFADRTNLYFPISLIKEALDYLKQKNCDFKIFASHHPLHFFNEFNSNELEDLIHGNFNIMFTGHIHKEEIKSYLNSNNGIYCNSTQATLSFEEKSEIGYSVIEYDFTNEGTINLERGTYITNGKEFIDLETAVIHLPCGIEKEKQNRLRQKITGKFSVELEDANKLLLDYPDDDKKNNFLQSFSPPIISTKSDTTKAGSSLETFIKLDEIINTSTSYLILGKDKSGKTSLLKKLQLYFLKTYSTKGVIPFYLDYKDFEEDNIDLIKLIAKYFEINQSDANQVVSESAIIFLIDNLNIQSPLHNKIILFLSEHTNIRFIFTSEYSTSRDFVEELDHLSYDKLYLKDLTRKEIRYYTQNNNIIKEADQDAIQERIVIVCKQLQLPLNYWTISLILLIYRKSNDDYSKNLFGILDLCVDEILQKKKLLFTKSKLTFDQYKELCSQLAYSLLIDHKDTTYSADYLTIIGILETYIRSKPRIVATSKDIFDNLFESGILKSKGDKFAFRLNGIFEYFLSYYIKENSEFKEEILNDDNIYLSFKNELEIYTGFNRKDVEFVRRIFNKTKLYFQKINQEYIYSNELDKTLVSKIKVSEDLIYKIRSLKAIIPLDNDAKDLLFDNQNPIQTQSEVQLKQIFDSSKLDYENLERYLIILARVFKNSDNIDDLVLINEIFDFLLESFCSLGFFLVDELERQVTLDNLNNSEFESDIVGEDLLRFVTRFVPIITQVMLYDGIGHQNLNRIISNKIVALEVNAKDNQYKLFLLYFLFIDNDLKGHKQKIDEVFERINLSILKVSTYFKLNFYLAFKAYKDESLANFLSSKIKTAQFRIDSKSDIIEIDKQLSQTEKLNIIRKSTERR